MKVSFDRVGKIALRGFPFIVAVSLG